MDFSSIWPWVVFNAFVLTLLALDLGVFHKERRRIPVKEALWMSFGYIMLAMAFNVGVYLFYDRAEVVKDGAVLIEGGSRAAAVEFLTGYFIEYALSMDNIMVFVIIMTHFRVPPEYQLRVLVWGIIGALVLRAIFIFAGLELIQAFDWIIYVFGAFLIFTGLKTLLVSEPEHDLEQNKIVRFSRSLMRVTPQYHGDKFFVVKDGLRYATPLFLVLIVLNLTDILFAVDSIPAIFAITQDPFIVYTSNVFAILGLRALYFALAGALDKFHLLRHGISLVLVVIGFKMIFNHLVLAKALPAEWMAAIADWMGPKGVPTEWALGTTLFLVLGSIALSLITKPSAANEEPQTKI